MAADADRLTPRRVRGILKRHDARMERLRPSIAAVAASIENRWWPWVLGETGRKGKKRYKELDYHYERNMMGPALATYLAQLFPRRMRAEVGRLATTRGDPDKAQLVLNALMFGAAQRDQLEDAIRMALAGPGAGFAVLYEDGDDDPMERVSITCFPVWELVVDDKATDRRRARFVGRVYWRPLAEVAEEYDLSPDDLHGEVAADFLETSERDRKMPRPRVAPEPSEEEDEECVRVLELCNLVDQWKGERGRFEVHLIDQGRASEKPVYVGRMPLEDHRDRAQPNYVALLLDSEVYHPLCGLAPAEAWQALQQEVNVYRSHVAQKTRRDKVVSLYLRSVLGGDLATRLDEAKDLERIAVPDEGAAKIGYDLRRAIIDVSPPPTTVDVLRHAETAVSDFQSTVGLSPSALGITQNVTAREILYQKDFTDSVFGRMAAARERVFAHLAALVLRAVGAAMWSASAATSPGEDGDSAEDIGDVETPDLEEPEPAGADDDNFDEAPGADEAKSGSAADTTEARGGRPAPQVVRLLDEAGQVVEVTADDLEGPFDIGFTEAGRTPLGEAETRANLVELLPQYIQLWAAFTKGGNDAVVAWEAMEAIYGLFRLPDNLAPGRLLLKLQERRAEVANDESALDRAATPVNGTPDLDQPPADALRAAAAAHPDDPNVQAIVQDALGMDPQAQAQALHVLSEYLGGAGGQVM